MITHTHKLSILGCGHDPRPEVDDFEVLHVMYQLETLEMNSETQEILRYATTETQLLELTPWNVESKIAGAEVTKEILEQWVSESINLEKLKQKNIANLQPLPQIPK